MDFVGMDYSGKDFVDIHTGSARCHFVGLPDCEESDSMDIEYMDSVLRILRHLVFHLKVVYPGLGHLLWTPVLELSRWILMGLMQVLELAYRKPPVLKKKLLHPGLATSPVSDYRP